MSEPDELDRAGRRLLSDYRAHTGPSPEVAARLLSAVKRDAQARASAADPALPPGVVPLRRRAWIAPAVLAAAAAALLALWLGPARQAARTDATGSAAAHVADDPAGRTALPRASGPVIEDRPDATGSEVPVPEDNTAPGPPPELRAPTPRRRESPAAPVPEDTEDLAAEMQRMRAAQLALGAGDPAGALAHLEDYARRFPAGQLQEEAQALRAIALCKTERRDEGRAVARSFLAARPGSMFAERVRAACEQDDATNSPGGGHPPIGSGGPPANQP